MLYKSKKEIYYSSRVIEQNRKVRIVTQQLLNSIQKVEIDSKKLFLTRSSKDSLNYLKDFSEVMEKLSVIEHLLKEQPSLYERLLPISKTIINELLTLDHFSYSYKGFSTDAMETLKREEKIYARLNNYWNELDEEEEAESLSKIDSMNSKISANLNYFLLLITLYVTLLSGLFFIIYFDVRKRQKLSAEIIKKSKELDTIINTAPALIFVKNAEKKFTLFNKAFLDFFKIDNQKILFKDIEEFIKKDEKWLIVEEDEAVINQKVSIKNIEREVTFSDGSKHWLNINKAPLFDEMNNVVGIVGVMDDITERIEFQDYLLKARKELEELNNQKNKLFSIIAHDLRSPFTGLIGFTEILIDDFNELSDDEKKFYVNNIYKSLKEYLTLIDNLLTWSRLNLEKVGFNPQNISIKKIINSVFNSIQILASNKNIKILSYVDDNTMAFADADMVETVLRNLVSNAIKFTNEGGEIWIKVTELNEMISVKVEDNGVGMELDRVQNIFNSNLNSTRGTNNEKGTGLGLQICKEFIEKNGGSISVESKVNCGTTFLFTLPLKK